MRTKIGLNVHERYRKSIKLVLDDTPMCPLLNLNFDLLQLK